MPTPLRPLADLVGIHIENLQRPWRCIRKRAGFEDNRVHVRHLAEIEINVLSRQCLDRRIPDRETLVGEVAAWQERRNASAKPVNRRFRTEAARIKLKSLYP